MSNCGVPSVTTQLQCCPAKATAPALDLSNQAPAQVTTEMSLAGLSKPFHRYFCTCLEAPWKLQGDANFT